ncbi:DNase I-like protein [Delitschia confertaspora ATCC 74209]|uniref:DNase I-like protein n=1 Tax=Delitschia confertaspora ATCC 74209 TaxID=1513339 RepID=A0A9P4JJN7_9PLEO|nr:DNase I-like protein [Delitschia confertaspora ATCC 74209]
MRRLDREISPPALKRRKLSRSKVETQLPETQSIIQSPTHTLNTIRIFSWNINGVTPFLQNPITNFFSGSRTSPKEKENNAIPPASLRAFLHRHHWPHILCLQEVKIAFTDTKTQTALKVAINRRLRIETGTQPRYRSTAEDPGPGPDYEVYLTLPTDRHNARGLHNAGKLYGVASIIRSDFLKSSVLDVRTVDWDSEGRVSVIEIEPPSPSPTDFPSCSSSPGKGLGKMALFNIYAVNGTDSPYRDPSTGAVIGTRHDRKLAVHRLLRDECVQMEKQGWKVLLTGDMNVAPTPLDGYPKLRTFPYQHCINRADFLSKFFGVPNVKSKDADVIEELQFQGVDVWRTMNGEKRGYTWYSRTKPWGASCDRVDYFIAGKSLWDGNFVKGAGILENEAERGVSDHCPIWTEVKIIGDGEENGGD